jgi:RNA recognition motif-containing protein
MFAQSVAFAQSCVNLDLRTPHYGGVDQELLGVGLLSCMHSDREGVYFYFRAAPRLSVERMVFFLAWSSGIAQGIVGSTGDLVLGKKLYAGNLSYKISSSDLEALFAPFGTVVSAQVIEDRESGRSKGFGFVEMSTDEEAQAAIQGLHGQDNNGRPLTVNEARPREDRGGGGGGRRGGRY